MFNARPFAIQFTRHEPRIFAEMQLFSTVPLPGKHANSIEPSGVADNRTVRGDVVGNNGRLFVGRGVSLGTIARAAIATAKAVLAGLFIGRFLSPPISTFRREPACSVTPKCC
jgi:hypothetical protein